MRYLLALIIVLLLIWLMVAPSFAEVYVLIDKDNNVLSAIEADMAVVKDGMTKVVLPGKIKDYGLTKHPTYYKLIDNDFIQNNEKVSEDANREKQREERRQDMIKIDKKMQRMACDKLVEEGVTLKLKCDDLEK